MIEKGQIANLHGFHIVGRLMIADTIPAFTCLAAIKLVLPRPR
jgi:hypothetical protein